MKRCDWLVGVAAGVVLIAVGAALAWGDAIGLPDASVLARGGVQSFDTPERSPGAPFEPGVMLQASGGGLYLGTGLVAGRVRVQWARASHATTLVVAQLASPIHRATEAGVAMRFRRGAWCAGAGVRATWFDFLDAPRVWRVTPVAGGAWTSGERWAVAGAFQLADAASAASGAGWMLAVRVAIAPGVVASAERERVAGEPGRGAAGLVVRRAGFDLGCGYDVAARAHSLGAAWNLDRNGIGVGWGARTHPDLGWSQVWSFVWRR